MKKTTLTQVDDYKLALILQGIWHYSASVLKTEDTFPNRSLQDRLNCHQRLCEIAGCYFEDYIVLRPDPKTEAEMNEDAIRALNWAEATAALHELDARLGMTLEAVQIEYGDRV